MGFATVRSRAAVRRHMASFGRTDKPISRCDSSDRRFSRVPPIHRIPARGTEGSPTEQIPRVPLLLAPLFQLLWVYPKESVQVWTVFILGIAELVLLYRLARHLVGRWPAIVVLAMAAVQPDIVANAARGLAEEGFMVLFFIFILMYLRTRRADSVGPAFYLLMGIVAGWMTLTRSDGAYVAVPVFAIVAWLEFRRSGVSWALVATVPILLLPFALPALAQSAMEARGIQAYGARAGRAYLQMEFMLGRMPYEYGFYIETSLKEWLFDHHSLGGLVTMIFKSSVRTALALGERLWGQLFTLFSLLGMVVYIRTRKEFVLPILVPLVILPQWILMSIYNDNDLFRYNIRTLPLLMLFAVLGFHIVGRVISDRAAFLARLPARETIAAIAVGFGVLLIDLLPFSLYQTVLPHVSPTRIYEEFLLKRNEVHPQLVEAWAAMADEEQNPEETRRRIEALRTQHEHYAPTHYLLGLLDVQRGRTNDAIAHFTLATDIVPYFAEAGCWTVEAEILRGNFDRAKRRLADLEQLRSDYPLVHLLRAYVSLVDGDRTQAASAFHRYTAGNRYQLRRALNRRARILTRQGRDTEAREAERALKDLTTPAAGMCSRFGWNYLGLDLPGLSIGPPDDRRLYYNMGWLHAQNGDLRQAEEAWTTMNQISPGHVASWANRGLLYARDEQTDRAVSVLLEGSGHIPGDARILTLAAGILEAIGRQDQAKQILADIDASDLERLHEIPRIDSDMWFPPEIILPLSRTNVSAAAVD
jgi:tetratricopeptide (TPR) repeat protein